MGWREQRPKRRKGKRIRYDDVDQLRSFTNRYIRGKALIMLGGPSVKDFDIVKARSKYDVILSVNGGLEPFGDYRIFGFVLEVFPDDYDVSIFDKGIKGHKIVNFKIWHRFNDRTRL